MRRSGGLREVGMGRQSGPGICAVAPLCLAAVAMGDLDPDSLERALVLNPSLFFCASLLSRSVDTVDWGRHLVICHF